MMRELSGTETFSFVFSFDEDLCEIIDFTEYTKLTNGVKAVSAG